MQAPAAPLAVQAALQAVAIVLLAGAVAGLAAARLRIPDIVLFLLAGIVLGAGGIGVLQVPAGSTLNQLVLVFGASYLLFDGGATLRLPVLREIGVTVVALATLGVLVTAAITAAAAHYLLALPPAAALLLGAVLAPTDPAALVPVLRNLRVRPRLAQLAISESACNDAMGAILAFGILGVALGGQFDAAGALRAFAWDALGGILLGLALGFLATLVIHYERLGFLERYLPLATLLVALGAALAAARIGASGFMAVFVAGIVVGNPPRGLRRPGEARELLRLHEFVASTSLLARMFIFVLLGSQVDLGALSQHAPAALGIVAVLVLLARPAAVLLCAAPDRRARWSLRELAFMCWTRETGVIPAALGGMIVSSHLPEAALVNGVIFMAVVLTIGIQAPTTGWLARRLGLMESDAG